MKREALPEANFGGLNGLENNLEGDPVGGDTDKETESREDPARCVGEVYSHLDKTEEEAKVEPGALYENELLVPTVHENIVEELFVGHAVLQGGGGSWTDRTHISRGKWRSLSEPQASQEKTASGRVSGL